MFTLLNRKTLQVLNLQGAPIDSCDPVDTLDGVKIEKAPLALLLMLLQLRLHG
jgi:hypothetical protein